MKMNQFDWISGLDQSGWIAAGLFVLFFVVAAITVIMMLKLRQGNKKNSSAETPEDLQETISRQRKPSVSKTEPIKTEKKEEDYSNPIEEAEVFLTYGLNKQAIDLLEKYLENSPSDKAAQELLARARK